jgi:hypothetical protein
VGASAIWRTFTYTIPSAIGALLCLVFLFVLAKKPSRLLLFFLCFYLISVYHLVGSFVTSLISRGIGRIGIQ